MDDILHADVRSPQVNFAVGLGAGAVNGVLLSPLAVIKYHGWGSNLGATFASASRDLMLRGGPLVFFKGVSVSVIRDSTFGVVYEVVRGTLRGHVAALDPDDPARAPFTFASDFFGAMAASAVSSPFNYVRNTIYATKPDVKPPSIARCLVMLSQEARTSDTPWKFLESRLFFGWGTTRVALGMGFGQFVYERIKRLMAQTD